jgi:phage FluMu gp28-like protein
MSGSIAPALPLYAYQRRWVNDDARFKIAMFARQCGKTFTSTLELALDCARAEALGQRRRWVILSRGERQAREAMNEGVKLHLAALSAGFKAYDYDWEPGVKALEVELPGGSKITALPANPDTARGFSANVLLDEFAFHQDSRAIWKALFPGDLKARPEAARDQHAQRQGQQVLRSDDGRWRRLEPPRDRHLPGCEADGLPRDIEELRKGAGDDDLWAQEFELKWLDEASAWLSFELIASCEHEAAGVPEHYQGGPCFVGVDIAARNDLFVIWVVELVGDVYWTREIIERKRVSFAEQDALLDDVFARYRVMRACMDQTGMGEKPVEDAQRRHGSTRVEGVLFTAVNKLTLATHGKEVFEDRKLRIPEGNPALRADLHKLKKVTGPTGTPRFVADSDSSGHADRTWAAFLALNAAAGDTGPVHVASRPRRSALSLEGY